MRSFQFSFDGPGQNTIGEWASPLRPLPSAQIPPWGWSLRHFMVHPMQCRSMAQEIPSTALECQGSRHPSAGLPFPCGAGPGKHPWFLDDWPTDCTEIGSIQPLTSINQLTGYEHCWWQLWAQLSAAVWTVSIGNLPILTICSCSESLPTIDHHEPLFSQCKSFIDAYFLKVISHYQPFHPTVDLYLSYFRFLVDISWPLLYDSFHFFYSPGSRGQRASDLLDLAGGQPSATCKVPGPANGWCISSWWLFEHLSFSPVFGMVGWLWLAKN